VTTKVCQYAVPGRRLTGAASPCGVTAIAYETGTTTTESETGPMDV
jgi:hypothetical protein